jgi:hypothetical protein
MLEGGGDDMIEVRKLKRRHFMIRGFRKQKDQIESEDAERSNTERSWDFRLD